MNKKTIVKIIIWTLNILTILLLVYSLINYKFLENEITTAVQIGGVVTVAILVFILEGAPVFVGSSVAVASLIAAKTNPWLLLIVFIVFAILGNFVYYYLGYLFGKKTLRYFDEANIKKYEKIFKKYGMLSMLVMAVSPVPYLPTIAGAFKMSKKDMFLTTMTLRMIRHTIVFFFWYAILV
jgi:membrane protein YqaA with SNARE-associated domain